MTEREFLLSLVYRDGARPAEIQLLLAHIAEILKEMQIAIARLNLDGSAAGEVTDEARSHSGELLRERFKKQAEQRKAEQEAARVAQEAAKAEQRRLGKLSQLTEKFGRKAK